MARGIRQGGIAPKRAWLFLTCVFSVLVIYSSVPSALASSRRVSSASGERCPWVAASREHAASPGRLAAEVTRAMTLTEKLEFVFLLGAPTVENTNTGIPSLCIPPLTLSDGPNGISNKTPGSVQLPAALGLAATFDTSLAKAYGKVLGGEARVKGIDAVQAPELNLARVPTSGRIFEAFGEDPVLTAAMGVAEVEGIQSEKVLSDAKHYSLYNQETARPRLHEIVSVRALQELYNAPFRAVVEEAHVASVMCAYGFVNGTEDCASPLLYRDLRTWGFRGFVRSDLGSALNVAAAFRAGMDLVKPGSLAELRGLFARHALTLGVLDAAVRRVLKEMFAFGLIAHPRPLDTATSAITPSRLRIALEVAERSMVLLKNEGGLLPLSRHLRSLAVIGTDAGSYAMSAAYGSAYVPSSEVVSPLAGLRRALPRTHIIDAPGGVPLELVPRLSSAELAQGHLLPPRRRHPHPVEPGTADLGVVRAANVSRDVLTANAPMRGRGWKVWRAVIEVPRSGIYELSAIQDGDFWCYLNGRLEMAMPGLHGPSRWAVTVPLVAKRRYRLVLRWFAVGGDGTPEVGLVDVSPAIAAAVREARRAKVAVVFASDFTKEGVDRPSLSLPGDANALIEAVARANPNTVVVLNTGGAVLMPWLAKVRSVLEAWYPGQVDGQATAAVLTGAVDPSGRLPVTFPPSERAIPVASAAQYPGVDGTVFYREGLDIGYRWYLAHHLRPLFPFGYGLSYTSFSLSGASVAREAGRVVVSVRVRNTGRRDGTDVVQAYLAYPPSANEPPEQLRAFGTVSLEPGASRTLRLVIARSGFEAWLHGRFETLPGTYRLSIGSNVEDLPISVSLPAP
jgi:beta-glucosidase